MKTGRSQGKNGVFVKYGENYFRKVCSLTMPIMKSTAINYDMLNDEFCQECEREFIRKRLNNF